MSEVVDVEAVEETTDLVHVGPSNLFRTDDPIQVVERARDVANALKGVIEQQGLVVHISGRWYPKVEAWTTLGSMLGVVPVVEWTRPISNGWEARVEARTLDGRVIGAAEAQCTRDERMWAKRDDYALRSMAQTRATSKALRGPLGFVVTLAGYEATPAEEIPAEPPIQTPTGRSDVTLSGAQATAMTGMKRPTGKSDVTPEPISKAQYDLLREEFARAGNPELETAGWLKVNAKGAFGESLAEQIASLSSNEADQLTIFLTNLYAE